MEPRSRSLSRTATRCQRLRLPHGRSRRGAPRGRKRRGGREAQGQKDGYPRASCHGLHRNFGVATGVELRLVVRGKRGSSNRTSFN